MRTRKRFLYACGVVALRRSDGNGWRQQWQENEKGTDTLDYLVRLQFDHDAVEGFLKTVLPK